MSQIFKSLALGVTAGVTALVAQSAQAEVLDLVSLSKFQYIGSDSRSDNSCELRIGAPVKNPISKQMEQSFDIKTGSSALHIIRRNGNTQIQPMVIDGRIATYRVESLGDSFEYTLLIKTDTTQLINIAEFTLTVQDRIGVTTVVNCQDVKIAAQQATLKN